MNKSNPEELFFPCLCNIFSIQRSDGEIVLDFGYRQRPKSKDDKEIIKMFARVAFTLGGAQKFSQLLINVLKKEPPKSDRGASEFDIGI